MLIDNRSSTSRPRQIDQQRFKYYSAIKTGFSHMEDVEEADLSISAYLQAPTHVVDDECFVIPLPLMLREAGEKQNSFVMVFSIWHTMIGTAVVSLPWAFQQSGIALGFCLCFSSYIVSFYTSKLIVDATGNDADFCITLKKYYGKPGYYAGIIAPALLLLGVVSALFVILSELSYPILLSLYMWCKPGDFQPKIEDKPVLDNFSSAYTAIGLYFLLVAISSKKNLGVFVRLGSLGAIFVSMFIIAITGLGAYSYATTDYQIGTTAQNRATIWANVHGVRTIVLFTANFSPLASLLNTGYYLHTCAVPILRNAKRPEHNSRNLFIGYTIVFISYFIIGSMGYIGFIGTLFSRYFVSIYTSDHSGQIAKNCLNVFGYTNPIAFIVRLAIFMLLFSTYPMVNLFLRTHLLNLLFQNQ